MKSTIIITSRQEERKKPVNLNQKDIDLFKHEFSLALSPVTAIELSNISVLRNVLFSLQKLTFFKAYTHLYSTPKKYFLKRLRLFLTIPQHLEHGIWITDEISSEYFHWFTDALTRLKAIASHEGTEMLKKQFPVVLPDSYKTKPYIIESLKLMGYKPFFYNPKKRLQVAVLLSCSHTAPTGNYNSDLILSINKSLAIPLKEEPNRKIYVSRAKALTRRVLNEESLTQLLADYGYEIHIFEDYTFTRQLEIMSSTKTMIGLHGAGLTNMLFMKGGGQILELRNEGDSHNNCYFSLSASLNHDYYYLNNRGDTEDTYNVNITVDPDSLKEILALLK